MKPALGAIIGYVLCAAILYGVISFVTWNTNAAEWPGDIRFLLVWFSFAGAALGYVKADK